MFKKTNEKLRKHNVETVSIRPENVARSPDLERAVEESVPVLVTLEVVDAVAEKRAGRRAVNLHASRTNKHVRILKNLKTKKRYS